MLIYLIILHYVNETFSNILYVRFKYINLFLQYYELYGLSNTYFI